MTIILIDGPPGVGKTTTIKKIFEKYPSVNVYEGDDIRKKYNEKYLKNIDTPDKFNKAIDKINIECNKEWINIITKLDKSKINILISYMYIDNVDYKFYVIKDIDTLYTDINIRTLNKIDENYDTLENLFKSKLSMIQIHTEIEKIYFHNLLFIDKETIKNYLDEKLEDFKKQKYKIIDCSNLYDEIENIIREK